MNNSETLSLSKYLEDLQQQGRYTFTKAEALEKIGCSKSALTLAIGRLVKKNRLLMPRRGFLVIIPTEYQVSGVVPASWYIEELMLFEQSPYYAGLLTAASLHGASHQQPQEFQVITPKQFRPIIEKGFIVHFYTKHHFSAEFIDQVKTYTGYMRVSSPALTALDLVQYQHASGYIHNVATVLAELGERIKKRDLQGVLEKSDDIPSVQRLGYLFDLVNNPVLANVVEAWLKKRDVRTASLIAGKLHHKEQWNDRWHLYINEQVEIDI